MKTTSNGRRPQKVQSGVSQQPLIGLFSNFKLKFGDQTERKHGRQPQMEDDLKWKMTSNGRRPQMEDDLKILKVEYLSNH
jgi:hypothetical protein